MTLRNKAMIALVFLLASCNDEAATSSAELNKDSVNPADLVVKDTNPTGCYIQAMEKDTATLQLEIVANNVTGSLSYRIFEKDRNDGTVQADQTGDIIKGWYLFKSEGIISVREVAWKINGEELWPATGDVIQRNDTTLFAQPDNLRYDSDRPFRKVPCVI